MTPRPQDAPTPAPPPRSPAARTAQQPTAHPSPFAAPESGLPPHSPDPDTSGTGDWDRNQQDQDRPNHISDNLPQRRLLSKLPDLPGVPAPGMSLRSWAAAARPARQVSQWAGEAAWQRVAHRPPSPGARSWKVTPGGQWRHEAAQRVVVPPPATAQRRAVAGLRCRPSPDRSGIADWGRNRRLQGPADRTSGNPAPQRLPSRHVPYARLSIRVELSVQRVQCVN